MGNTGILIIFVKNPVLGRVKTRLARDLGDHAALEVYKVLLAHSHGLARKVEAKVAVFYSDFIEPQDMWACAGFRQFLQDGEDLGQRMHHAFECSHNMGYRRMVLIGSDCLELSPEIIGEAFSKLEDHDAVIGPAMDGGYYLIGLRTPDPRLFMDKTWSTDTVLETTMSYLQQCGKSVWALPRLSDIDEVKDLNGLSIDEIKKLIDIKV